MSDEPEVTPIEPTADQVSQIVAQVSDEKVASFEFRPGNYNDHCFLVLTSGRRLVIRFSRRGWEGGHWKIEKFSREGCAANILSRETGLSTPQTLIVDGSRSIIDMVYAVQCHVSGLVFRDVFDSATADEKITLLHAFGDVASQIHKIDFPDCDYDEDYAYITCDPLLAKCPHEHVAMIKERLAAERVEGSDGTGWALRRTSLHRAEFTSDTAEAFRVSIDDGIKTLRDQDKAETTTARSLSTLFERHWPQVAEHLGRRNFCHGDYHFANIMVESCHESELWKIAGVFDLDLFQATCPIEDFGKAEEFDFPSIDIPGFRRHILRGYANDLDQLDYSILTLGSWLGSSSRIDRASDALQDTRHVDESTLVEIMFGDN
jgi:aminoglycoside phosphotransferase (APT) family kinase protein